MSSSGSEQESGGATRSREPHPGSRSVEVGDASRSLLRRVRFRLVLRSFLEDLQPGLAAGAVVGFGIVAWHRFVDPALDPLTALLAGGVTAIAVPTVGVLLRRRSDTEIAAAADDALHLRERLSTALWSTSGETTAGPLAGLVREDADRAARIVAGADLSRAFRPTPRRTPLLVAAVALAATTGLLLVGPAKPAPESPEKKVLRLADQARIAEVAKKLEDEAKRVQVAARERKQEVVEKKAADLRLKAESLRRDPPSREEALQELSQLAESVREEIRKQAAVAKAATPPEQAAQDRALDEMLENLSKAGIETLVRDTKSLAERLAKERDGDPSAAAQDLRDMAARLDAMRKALSAMENGDAQSDELRKKLANLGNEDLLEKIAEKMREMASKMDQRGYESLESEAADTAEAAQSLEDMSREELEELLKELEEMASMQDMEQLLAQAGQEMKGGRKMRLGGSGGT